MNKNDLESTKELFSLFKDWWKELTIWEKLRVAGIVAFAAVLVIGGIYLVAFSGYISGT